MEGDVVRSEIDEKKNNEEKRKKKNDRLYQNIKESWVHKMK